MNIVASTHEGEVTFLDTQGRNCLVKMNGRDQWDLFINGQHRVQNVTSFRLDGDTTLHFEGTRLMFNEKFLKLSTSGTTVMASVFRLKVESYETKPLTLMRGGDIRLVSGLWLLERTSDYIVQRCQELPPEAFLDPSTAAHLYTCKDGLVILSYPWLTKQHPDPAGFHFKFVHQYVAKHMAFVEFTDFGIFWDFMSLPQPGPDGKKTPQEQAILKRGLGGINFLYGSPNTIVIQLKTLPERNSGAFNTQPYELRGWCVFEAAVSNIKKPSVRVLDMSAQVTRQALAREGTTWEDVQKLAATTHKPPLHPDGMRKALAKSIFTQGDADRSFVDRKYEEFFYHAAGSTRSLKYMNIAAWNKRNSLTHGFNDQVMAQLGSALRAYIVLEDLWLSFHPFTDTGLYKVLEQLPMLKHFSGLGLTGCGAITGTAFRALRSQQVPNLHTLALNGTSINDAGMSMLAPNLASLPKLANLWLSDCQGIGRKGFSLLGKFLHNASELVFLMLRKSSLDDAGLKEIMPALPGLRRLSRFDIGGCVKVGVHGLRTLIEHVPQLAVHDAGLGKCWLQHDGNSLEPAYVGNGTPLIVFCLRCGDPCVKGTLCYICGCRRFTVCQRCLHGALVVPSHLRATPEFEALIQVWISQGRDERHLVVFPELKETGLTIDISHINRIGSALSSAHLGTQSHLLGAPSVDQSPSECEADNAALRKAAVTLKVEMAALRAEKTELQAENKTLRSEVLGLESQTDTLSSENFEMQAEIERLRAQVRHLQGAQDKRGARASTRRESTCSQAQTVFELIVRDSHSSIMRQEWSWAFDATAAEFGDVAANIRLSLATTSMVSLRTDSFSIGRSDSELVIGREAFEAQGYADLFDFLKGACNSTQGPNLNRRQWMRAFDTLDYNQDGIIDRRELAVMYKVIGLSQLLEGIPISDNALQAAMAFLLGAGIISAKDLLALADAKKRELVELLGLNAILTKRLLANLHHAGPGPTWCST